MKDIAATTSCSQYSGGLEILRKLGKEDVANNLIELFIEERKGTPEIFNVDSVLSNPFDINDALFKEELRKAYLEHNPKPTVEEILENRRKTNSYNAEEAEILNELTEEEIYRLFMGFRGEDLIDFIRVFLLIANSSPELSRKVRNTLTRISELSDLNKARMAKFYNS